MKIFVISMLTLVLLGGYVGRVSAEEIDRSELYERLKQVDSNYKNAGSNFDFYKQLELAKELVELLKQIDDPNVGSVSDFNRGIDDIKKRAAFNESQVMLDNKRTQFYDDTLLEIDSGNHERAINHYQKYLEISDQLYGKTSFLSLQAKVYLANLYSLTRQKEEGLAHVSEVKQVLQEDRNESKLYIDAMIIEMDLNLYSGETEKAILQGKHIVSLLEESGRKKTNQYYNIQGSVAAQLNELKRHKEALGYAHKGLKNKTALSNSNKKYIVRLFREYVRAKKALNDYEKVPEAFDELLRISAITPDFPSSDRAAYMEEYASVLRKLGRDQEAEEIEQEIMQLGVEPVVSQDKRYQAGLFERLSLVESKAVRARKSYEFKELLDLKIEIVGMLRQIDDPVIMGLPDLILELESIKKIVGFNDSQLMDAKKQIEYDASAFNDSGRENHKFEIHYYHKSLLISNQLYGTASFNSLHAKVELANLYLLTKRNHEGLAYAEEVMQVMYENRNESDLYLSAAKIASNFYLVNGQVDKSINLSIEIAALLEENHRQKTAAYLHTLGIIAEKLNKQYRHQEALDYVRKGLNHTTPVTNDKRIAYGVLLLQYARANIALKDYENVPKGFEPLLKMAAEIHDFPAAERVGYMEEYIPVLRKLGRNLEADQMAEQVKHLRFDLPLQKSRFTD